MFEVQNLIFMYILLCCSTLVFNIFYMIYHNNSKYNRKIENNRITQSIDYDIDTIKKGNCIPEKDKKRLEKKLRKVNNMFILEDALSKHKLKDIEIFMNEFKEMFINLCSVYLKKDAISRSYYAYILGKFMVRFDEEVPQLNHYLFTLLKSDSIYCIDNALSVFYKLGKVDLVLKAFNIVSNKGIYQNSNMITKGICKFNGDKENLADKLFERFGSFNDNFKIAIINYISELSNKSWNDKMYQLICIKNLKIELKIAIVNYFSKNYDDRIKPVLYNALNQRDLKEIEYVLVVIKALKNYPCNETIEILKKMLNKRNWNIQIEAAKVLSFLGVEYFQIADIYNGENQSARNILMYMRRRESKKGA